MIFEKTLKRIVVEFEDFLFESCSLQNLTISDDGTGRKVGPYCNSQGKFIKKLISSKISIHNVKNLGTGMLAES